MDTSPAASATIPHLARRGTATQLIVDGAPLVLLAGEVHNSSSSCLAYMAPLWERLVALHCNAVLAPVSWELLEPAEGQFDFSLVDGLLAGARGHGLKLIPLWFGTWKNTLSTYAPEWVKTDLDRFPRAQAEAGRNSGAVSCLCEEAREADARAFARLMAHLRETDGGRHTAPMVQVENETGLLGAPRDHCPLAEEAFRAAVPDALMGYIAERREGLHPYLRWLWSTSRKRESGSWRAVFGEGADEVFMAWHIGQFVERVAQAGQAEYPLPMFVNAWLVAHGGQKPGEYPSGGPVSRMVDVWRCAAPSIALLAPDIYLPDFAAICADYAREGNPLLIPEAHRTEVAAANAFYAVGEHDAIGFAPFGIDSMDPADLLGESYAVLASLMPAITEHHGTEHTIGILQDKEETVEATLGAYRLHIQFSEPREEGRPPGGGLIIALDDHEFLVAGLRFSVEFRPAPGSTDNVDFLSLEEGAFANGHWAPGRRLNGDEHRLVLGDRPCIRRARLYTHP